MPGSVKQIVPSSQGEHDVLRQEFNKLVAEFEALALAFNTHTHRYDPTQASVRNTSIPQTTAASDTSTATAAVPAVVTGTVRS